MRRRGASRPGGRPTIGGVCGRYTATTAPATIADRFGLDERTLPLHTLGRANVCPTDGVLAAVADGPGGARRALELRWGLAPSWATLKGMRPLVNARDDKLRTSGAWRRLAERGEHRCLVLADGWLEWQRPEKRRAPRQPFLHRLPGGEPFALAGLWCVARPKDAGEPVASCTVVTVAANREARILHDRMPAILDGPEAEAAWLDPATDLDGALDLLAPYPDGRVEVHPVSPRINTAGVEGLDLLAPVAAGEGAGPPPGAQTSLL
jgi:putative SOS response-associated peptidase YedK